MNLILSTLGVTVSMGLSAIAGAIVWSIIAALFMLAMPYIVPVLGLVAVIGMWWERRDQQ